MDITQQIYVAIAMGAIARIVFMDGYNLKPVYQDGKFQLNVIGTIIASICGAFLAAQASPEQFATPFGAFVAAFGTSYTIDRVITKVTPNPEEEVLIA